MSAAAVEFFDVVKSFGSGSNEVRALRGVSLRVEPGEFVAMMGPSGCGKSTLLHLAGGLENPSAGRVYVGGRDVADLDITARAALRRREVGYVFQRLNLLASLTALENVSLPLGLEGVGVKLARSRALRLGTIGGVLALVALIVALGMALWAAEGRDERDTLMVIGASPSDLASIAALKAWLLTFVGGLLAVTLGFSTLRMAVKAAHEPTTFPTLYSVVFVGASPMVVGLVIWISSAAAQRLRPVTASAMIGE